MARMAASEDATLAFGTGLPAHPMTPRIPTADDTTAAQLDIDFMTLSFLFVGSFVIGVDGRKVWALKLGNAPKRL